MDLLADPLSLESCDVVHYDEPDSAWHVAGRSQLPHAGRGATEHVGTGVSRLGAEAVRTPPSHSRVGALARAGPSRLDAVHIIPARGLPESRPGIARGGERLAPAGRGPVVADREDRRLPAGTGRFSQLVHRRGKERRDLTAATDEQGRSRTRQDRESR